MKALILVFALSRFFALLSHIANEYENMLFRHFGPPKVECRLIAQDEGYCLHLLSGTTMATGNETVWRPGVSIVHTDLKTGRMRCLVSTGMKALAGVRDTNTLSTLVGLEQSDEFLAVVMMTSVSRQKPDTAKVDGTCRYFFEVFRKSNGELLYSCTFPTELRENLDWPEETTEAGVITKLDNGIEVFGTVFEFAGDGRIIRRDSKKEKQGAKD